MEVTILANRNRHGKNGIEYWYLFENNHLLNGDEIMLANFGKKFKIISEAIPSALDIGRNSATFWEYQVNEKIEFWGEKLIQVDSAADLFKRYQDLLCTAASLFPQNKNVEVIITTTEDEAFRFHSAVMKKFKESGGQFIGKTNEEDIGDRFFTSYVFADRGKITIKKEKV